MVSDLQSLITVGLDYLRMSKGGGYQDFDQGDFGHVSSSNITLTKHRSS